MWWKIYFWVITVLTIIGLFSYLSVVPWNLASWYEIITSILAIVGLYAYVFNKKIFNNMVWKVFFWIVIVDWVANLIYELSPLKEMYPLPGFIESQMKVGVGAIIFAMILTLPGIYGIYYLGQGKTLGKTSKKKKK